MGRGHRQSAVRKAEARPPEPDAASQVAANLTGRVMLPRGPEATGRLLTARTDAEGSGTNLSQVLGLVVLCPSQRSHQPTQTPDTQTDSSS